MNRQTATIVFIAITTTLQFSPLSIAQGVIVTREEHDDGLKIKEITKTIDGGGSKTEPIRIDNNVWSINSGVYLLNPYKIVNTNVLEKGDAEASFFIEFGLNYVSAWNYQTRLELWEQKSYGVFFPQTIDFQGRFSAFVSGGDDEQTAAAIVGSGDFSAEISLSYPIWFRTKGPGVLPAKPVPGKEDEYFLTTDAVHSVGPIISYSATTDRSAFDVHHRILAGATYKTAFKFYTPGTEVKREALVNVTVGSVWIERVEFVDRSSRVIKLEYGDVPEYELSQGYGIEAEVYLPLSDVGYFTFGTRIYGGQDPNPWNAYMGLTFPIGQIKNLFKSGS